MVLFLFDLDILILISLCVFWILHPAPVLLLFLLPHDFHVHVLSGVRLPTSIDSSFLPLSVFVRCSAALLVPCTLCPSPVLHVSVWVPFWCELFWGSFVIYLLEHPLDIDLHLDSTIIIPLDDSNGIREGKGRRMFFSFCNDLTKKKYFYNTRSCVHLDPAHTAS